MRKLIFVKVSDAKTSVEAMEIVAEKLVQNGMGPVVYPAAGIDLSLPRGKSFGAVIEFLEDETDDAVRAYGMFKKDLLPGMVTLDYPSPVQSFEAEMVEKLDVEKASEIWALALQEYACEHNFMSPVFVFLTAQGCLVAGAIRRDDKNLAEWKNAIFAFCVRTSCRLPEFSED